MGYRLALILVCLGALPGCGQKGPLVLPERNTRLPVIAKPQSAPPAPVSTTPATGAVPAPTPAPAPGAAPSGPAGSAAPSLPVPPADEPPAVRP